MFVFVVKQHVLVQLEPTQLPFRSIRALFEQASMERLLLARFCRQIKQLAFVYPNTLLHRSERFEWAVQKETHPCLLFREETGGKSETTPRNDRRAMRQRQRSQIVVSPQKFTALHARRRSQTPPAKKKR